VKLSTALRLEPSIHRSMSGVLFSYAKYFLTHYRHRRRLMLLLGGLFLSTFVTFYSHTYNNNTQRCSVLLLWHELFACCFLCKCKHLMGTAFREREVISPYHILNKTLCWLISSHRTVEVLNEYQNRQYTEKGWKKENIKQDKKRLSSWKGVFYEVNDYLMVFPIRACH
jgi:hypothetical protein